MEIIKDEKQDFILDSEKKQIEVKILEAVEAKQHIEEAKKESEKDIQQKSLKKPKATLISEFIELQKTVCTKDKDGLEILEYPESALKKLTKPEIIKLIANYANRKIETNFLPDVKTLIDVNASPAKANMSLEDLMALGMHNMNICALSILEVGGHLLKEKTGNFNLLENLPKEAEERKEAFMVVFRQIYKENQEQVNMYLSPIVQYGILLSQCATITICKNTVKKKEDSSKK